MDDARERALWEHNLARTYNKAINKAAWLAHDMLEEDEDTMNPVTEAILALVVDVYPEEVEELFRRRAKLLEVKSWPKLGTFTPEQEAEYQDLCTQIQRLPSGQDRQDQEARDMIMDAARLLRKHHVAD